MSAPKVAPLVLYSAARQRTLRLQRLRGVSLPIVVASVYSGDEQLLEREVASGTSVASGLGHDVACVQDSLNIFVCGGMFALDVAEVEPVKTWLAKVYA